MNEIIFDVELQTDFPFEVDLDYGELTGIGPKSYRSLSDLPRLNGETIIDDMYETDPTVPSWAKAPTKPEYSAEDVGAVAEKDLGAFTPSDLEIMWDSIE